LLHRYDFLRPRDLGEILDISVQFFRANFKLLFGIVAIAGVPTLLLRIILTLLWNTFFPTEQLFADIDDPILGPLLSVNQIANNPLASSAQLIDALVGLFTTAALYSGVIMRLRGEPVRISSAYGRGVSRVAFLFLLNVLIAIMAILLIIPVFLLALIPTAGPALFTIAALVVGSVVAVRLSVAGQAVVNEGHDPIRAISRSWRLVGANFWRSLLLLFVLLLFSTILQLLPGVITGFLVLLVPYPTVAGVAALIANSLMSYVIAPLSIVVTTFLHIDLRIRSEGLDLQLRAQAIKDAALAKQAADAEAVPA
jgi:hypothetical protein